MELEQEEQVIYEGRQVSKAFFRVFVYGINGGQKLVDSYDKYLMALKSGEWVPSIRERDELLANAKKPTEEVVEDKPKPRRK